MSHSRDATQYTSDCATVLSFIDSGYRLLFGIVQRSTLLTWLLQALQLFRLTRDARLK